MDPHRLDGLKPLDGLLPLPEASVRPRRDDGRAHANHLVSLVTSGSGLGLGLGLG